MSEQMWGRPSFFVVCHAALFAALLPPRCHLRSLAEGRVYGRPQETMVCPTAMCRRPRHNHLFDGSSRYGAEHE